MHRRTALLALAATAGGAALAATALAAPGDVDPSFGDRGVSTASFPPSNQANVSSMVERGDGTVVAAGSSGRSNARGSGFSFAQFTPSGALDPRFGGDGRVVVEVGGSTSTQVGTAVALQNDGRLVAAGTVLNSGPTGALLRLNVNGSIDGGFSGGVRRFNDAAVDVEILPNGKILVLGETQLRRFSSRGALDKSFGKNGIVNLRTAGAVSMAVQSNGRILVSGVTASDGTAGTGGEETEASIERLNANGSRDRSFNSGNLRHVPFGCSALRGPEVTLDARGRAVLAGGGIIGSAEFAAVARLTTAGRLDGSFGNGGTTMLALPVPGQKHRSADLQGAIVQDDGRIVGFGTHLLRLNVNGTLDPTFGNRGSTPNPLPRTTAAPNDAVAALIQPSGRLVIAGSNGGTNAGSTSAFSVAGVSLIGQASGNVQPVNSTRPSAPRGLEVTARNRTLQLSWLGPSRSGASSVRGFVVQYRQVGDSRFSAACSTSGFLTIPNLVNGADYQVRVAAGNNVGLGPFTSTITARIRG